MKDYLDWKDEDFINQFFTDIIEKIVDDRIKKLNFDRKVAATVVSFASGYATIKLNDNLAVSISNVKVRDGLTLSANDQVYVTFINGSSSNFFVDLKK